jgi:hypothetical protein
MTTSNRYLFVIDVQNPFFTPGSGDLVPEPDKILKNIKSVLDKARDAGVSGGFLLEYPMIAERSVRCSYLGPPQRIFRRL